MKTLKASLTINLVAGFFSVLSMIALFLAMADIGHNEPDLTLEWKVAGISMVIIGIFIVSTFITSGFILKNWNRLFKE